MPVGYYRDVSAASPPGPPTHIGSAGRSASRRLGDSPRRVCLGLGREWSAARPAVHPGGQFRLTSVRRSKNLPWAVSGLGTGTRVSLLGESASVDGRQRRRRSSSA